MRTIALATLIGILAMISNAYADQYIGDLSNNPYNPNAVSNPYGAGNRYAPNSLNNPYGRYGNPYSDYNPNNPYANNPPKLYTQQGQYRGDLTRNSYDPNSVNNPYGEYGSPYSSKSLHNPYGLGNPYNPNNPRNPYGQGLMIIGQ